MNKNMSMIWNIRSINSSEERTVVKFNQGVSQDELERYNRWIAEAYSFQVEIDWRDDNEVWITKATKE